MKNIAIASATDEECKKDSGNMEFHYSMKAVGSGLEEMWSM